MNIHIIVLVATILSYIFLRRNRKENESVNVYTIIFIDLILYSIYYYFFNSQVQLHKNDSNDLSSLSNQSTDLLSAPYPVSSSSL